MSLSLENRKEQNWSTFVGFVMCSLSCYIKDYKVVHKVLKKTVNYSSIHYISPLII